MGRQTCRSLHCFCVAPGSAVGASGGSGKDDRSWNVGKQSRQTSPSVKEGIFGHHFDRVRNGVGVCTSGGVVDEKGKWGKAARSNLEKFGSGSSGGVEEKYAD
jgi:hypothetical protein